MVIAISLMRTSALPAVVVFMVLVGLAAGSTFISDDVFQTHGSTGRGLLQAKTNCPISFEFKNYTIITSQCKGPKYPADKCCAAFKEFACPYAAELNDGTNDCASTMFSYINLYGKYPPGLFASECQENKQGLSCSDYSSQSANETDGTSHMSQSLVSLTVLVCGVVLVSY